MILGRPTALWAGLVAAVLNALAALYVLYTGSPMNEQTLALFAAVNALAMAIIGVLANVAVTGSFLGRLPAGQTHRQGR